MYYRCTNPASAYSFSRAPILSSRGAFCNRFVSIRRKKVPSAVLPRELFCLFRERSVEERYDLCSRAIMLGGEAELADTVGDAVPLRPGDRLGVVGARGNVREPCFALRNRDRRTRAVRPDRLAVQAEHRAVRRRP